MARDAEHAESWFTYKPTYHRQHWYIRGEELSVGVVVGEIIPCKAVVQAQDWKVGFYADDTGVIMAR